jgi:hypothetical protein
MTVRLVTRVLQMAGVITAWAGAVSLTLGLFATACGVALGAVHDNLGLAVSFGQRGLLAGLIAGAIVGLCVVVDCFETESYLAKNTVPPPPASEWPTTVAVQANYPEWPMAHVKSLREG